MPNDAHLTQYLNTLKSEPNLTHKKEASNGWLNVCDEIILNCQIISVCDIQPTSTQLCDAGVFFLRLQTRRANVYCWQYFVDKEPVNKNEEKRENHQILSK